MQAMRLYVALWGKGSLKVGQSISGCLCAWIIFCQSRRFAAYHEQGQAPAPRRRINHLRPDFRLPRRANIFNRAHGKAAYSILCMANKRQPEIQNGNATARSNGLFNKAFWLASCRLAADVPFCWLSCFGAAKKRKRLLARDAWLGLHPKPSAKRKPIFRLPHIHSFTSTQNTKKAA